MAGSHQTLHHAPMAKFIIGVIVGIVLIIWLIAECVGGIL